MPKRGERLGGPPNLLVRSGEEGRSGVGKALLFSQKRWKEGALLERSRGSASASGVRVGELCLPMRKGGRSKS